MTIKASVSRPPILQHLRGPFPILNPDRSAALAQPRPNITLISTDLRPSTRSKSAPDEALVSGEYSLIGPWSHFQEKSYRGGSCGIWTGEKIREPRRLRDWRGICFGQCCQRWGRWLRYLPATDAWLAEFSCSFERDSSPFIGNFAYTCFALQWIKTVLELSELSLR